MPREILHPKLIAGLGYQREQACDAFTRAVRSREFADAIWAEGLFNAYGNTLQQALRFEAFMDWHRGTQRAQQGDPYLLAYAIGSTPSTILRQRTDTLYGTPSFERPALESPSLADALKTNVPYGRLRGYASQWASAGDFDMIVATLDAVRSDYPVAK